MRRVFISTTTFGNENREPLNILESNNIEVEQNSYGRKLKEHECLKLFNGFDGILAGTEEISERVLRTCKSLKVISRVGIGLDNIDLEAARERGIRVYSTSTDLSLAVVELTLALILDLLRGISRQYLALRSGLWRKEMGSLLSGKTLGIVGLGRIGKTLVKMTQGFSLSYLAHDIEPDDEFAARYNVKYVDLDTLLRTADIVSFHVGYTKDLENMIARAQLDQMKKKAIIINTSRGEIINESDLESAISEGKIAGAGLDVYGEEPYRGSLVNYDNVVLTPHIGSYADEVRANTEINAVLNLIKGFEELT